MEVFDGAMRALGSVRDSRIPIPGISPCPGFQGLYLQTLTRKFPQGLRLPARRAGQTLHEKSASVAGFGFDFDFDFDFDFAIARQLLALDMGPSPACPGRSRGARVRRGGRVDGSLATIRRRAETARRDPGSWSEPGRHCTSNRHKHGLESPVSPFTFNTSDRSNRHNFGGVVFRVHAPSSFRSRLP
jgi:hypothetical protein